MSMKVKGEGNVSNRRAQTNGHGPSWDWRCLRVIMQVRSEGCAQASNRQVVSEHYKILASVLEESAGLLSSVCYCGMGQAGCVDESSL